MNNQHQIEEDIKSKHLESKRVTAEDVQASIASSHYFTASDSVLGAYTHEDSGIEVFAPNWEIPRSMEALNLLTFCVLVLRNGTTITGQSTCTNSTGNAAKVAQVMARQAARRNAEDQIWPLLDYMLREQASK